MDIPRQRTGHSRRTLYVGSGVTLLLLGAVALARLEPAAPVVDRATVWTDTVRLGEMVREVRGPGTLVAEEVRWVAALAQGRVERKLVEPGTAVEAETVLLELGNPDIDRQALEAERQLVGAQAELTSLRAGIQNQILAQEAAVATVTSESRETARQLQMHERLAEQGMDAPMETQRARDRAAELRTRLEIERQRLAFLRESMGVQTAAQEAQVSMLRGIVDFHRQQVESMRVRAGSAGVLQELPLELGQWVSSGATLAKVVQPARLKAVLRIPETQARDLAVGQAASVDTRNGIVAARVTRIDPSVQNGTVAVDLALVSELPRGARPDLSVEGTIEIERLPRVLHVGRPAHGQAESSVTLFSVEEGGRTAVRVAVRLGRGSARSVEVVNGLREGDVVILSDMSAWGTAERVRIQ